MRAISNFEDIKCLFTRKVFMVNVLDKDEVIIKLINITSENFMKVYHSYLKSEIFETYEELNEYLQDILGKTTTEQEEEAREEWDI